MMRGHVLVRPGHARAARAAAAAAGSRRRGGPGAGGADLRHRSEGLPARPSEVSHADPVRPRVRRRAGRGRAARCAACARATRSWRRRRRRAAICYYCQREQENLCAQVMETMVLGAYAEYVKLPGSVVRTNLFAKPRGAAVYARRHCSSRSPASCTGSRTSALRPDDTVRADRRRCDRAAAPAASCARAVSSGSRWWRARARPRRAGAGARRDGPARSSAEAARAPVLELTRRTRCRRRHRVHRPGSGLGAGAASGAPRRPGGAVRRLPERHGGALRHPPAALRPGVGRPARSTSRRATCGPRTSC